LAFSSSYFLAGTHEKRVPSMMSINITALFLLILVVLKGNNIL